MICSNCNCTLEGKFKFCPECGMKTKEVCRSCGVELLENSKFCFQCGEPVVDSIANVDDLDFKDRNFFEAAHMTSPINASYGVDALISNGDVYFRNKNAIYKSEGIGTEFKKLYDYEGLLGNLNIVGSNIYLITEDGFIVANIDGNGINEYKTNTFNNCEAFLVLNNRIYANSVSQHGKGDDSYLKSTIISTDLEGEDLRIISESYNEYIDLCYGYKDEILFISDNGYSIYNIKSDEFISLEAFFDSSFKAIYEEEKLYIETIGIDLFERCVYIKSNEGIKKYKFGSSNGVKVMPRLEDFEYGGLYKSIEKRQPDKIDWYKNEKISLRDIRYNGKYIYANAFGWGNSAIVLKVDAIGNVEYLTSNGCNYGGKTRLYKDYAVLAGVSTGYMNIYIFDFNKNEVFYLSNRTSYTKENEGLIDIKKIDY